MKRKVSRLQCVEEDLLMEAEQQAVILISEVHDLAMSSAHRSDQRLELLLSKQPELVNHRDHALNTPLHWAAGAGQTEKVRLLLEKKADPLLQNSMGDTALHRAVFRDHLDVVVLLLQQKPMLQIESKNCSNQNPLDLMRSVKVGACIQRTQLEASGALDVSDEDSTLSDEVEQQPNSY